MQQAFTQIAREKCSIYQVFRQSISQGLKCSRSHFFRLLRNPIYCGKIIIPAFEKEKQYAVVGEHARIISERMFNEVQKIIAVKGQGLREPLANDNFPLRGFLLCPVCRKTLTGSASKGHLKRYHYYHCSSGCKYRIRADILNIKIIEAISNLVPNKHCQELYREMIDDLYRDTYEYKVTGQSHIIKGMEQIIDRVAKAKDTLYSGGIDAEDFTAIKDNCEKRIHELGIQLQNVTMFEFTKENNLKRCYKSLYQLGGIYKKAEVAVKRQFLQILFAGKIVLNDYVENIFNLPTRLIFNLAGSESYQDDNIDFIQSDQENEIRYVEILKNRCDTIPIFARNSKDLLSIVRVLYSLASINLKIV